MTCIGCEKAIKLFKDTQEVEKHGGIWTKEGDRRYETMTMTIMLNVRCILNPLFMMR